MEVFAVNGNLSIDTSNVYVDGKKADLSVCHIKSDDYYDLVANDGCISNVVYVVEDPHVCAYGQRVTDVADPISAQDAVTLKYMNEHFSGLSSEVYVTSADVVQIVKQQMKTVLNSIKI